VLEFVLRKNQKNDHQNRKTAKTSKYLNLQICGTVRGTEKIFIESLALRIPIDLAMLLGQTIGWDFRDFGELLSVNYGVALVVDDFVGGELLGD
jgi:hypothetical protein